MYAKCKLENHFFKWYDDRMKRLVLEEELVECRRNSGESESGGVKMRLKSNLRLRLQGICLGNLSLGFKISEPGGGGAYL